MTGAPPTVPFATPAHVTVYGAKWCEDTRRSRRLLRRLGVAHRYRDVDDDPGALDEATRLNRGARRTPVVHIDEHVLVEPANDALTRALVRGAYLTPLQVHERLNFQNVGDAERLLRVGGGLTLYAAARATPPVARVPLALLGGVLMLTGVAGWCPVYGAAGLSSLGGPGDRIDEAERTGWLKTVEPMPSQ
jgi:mycoredoxin